MKSSCVATPVMRMRVWGEMGYWRAPNEVRDRLRCVNTASLRQGEESSIFPSAERFEGTVA